jgi:hypothetical protein
MNSRIVDLGRDRPGCKQGSEKVKTRRGFLRTILAAPVAAVVAAAGLSKWDRLQRLGVLQWKPLGVKYKRYIGKMRITPEAFQAVYGGGRGGGKTEYQRQLTAALKDQQIQMNRFQGGFFTAAQGDDSGVRKVGGAGAYPSEVTGA